MAIRVGTVGRPRSAGVFSSTNPTVLVGIIDMDIGAGPHVKAETVRSASTTSQQWPRAAERRAAGSRSRANPSRATEPGGRRSAWPGRRSARSTGSRGRRAPASGRASASFTSSRQPVPTVPLPEDLAGPDVHVRRRPGEHLRERVARRPTTSRGTPRLAVRRPRRRSPSSRGRARSAPRRGRPRSSSGVTIHGPIVIAKSLPFAGPSRTVDSSRWRSRADQSLTTK